MVIPGNGYSIYGATVFGTGPIGHAVHVPFDRRITALYGLNGAGKSRLLHGIKCALTGVRPPADRDDELQPAAHLHVGLAGGQKSLLEQVVLQAVIADIKSVRGTLLEKAFAASGGSGNLGDVLASPGVYGEDLLEDALIKRMTLLVQDASNGQANLIEVLAAGADFTLLAEGTREAPLWRIAPALPLEDRHNRMLLAQLAGWQSRSAGLAEKYNAAPDDAILRAGLDELFNEPAKLLGLMETSVTDPYLIQLPGDNIWSLPDWLAIPLHSVGRTSQSIVELMDGTEPETDLDLETVVRLVELNGSDPQPGATLVLPAREVTETANRVLRLVLPGGTSELGFDLLEPVDWLLGRRPHWTARLRGGAHKHPLAALSAAQQRWARLAARLALRDGHGQPLVFLCDEPEGGLHRKAEEQLAAGLASAMDDRAAFAVVATHSPFLLNQPKARPVLVHRELTSGQTTVSPVPLAVLDELDAEHAQDRLGLTPGALLDLMRVAVLVEGLHDVWLLRATLHTDLEASMANVYPMRGAKGLRSLAEANLLFTGTNAPILLVLDNIQIEVVHTWELARLRAQTGDADAATELLLSVKDRGQGELRWLKELGRLAIRTGRLDRLHVFGLTQIDAVCYLPANALLKGGRDWEAAVAAYAAAESSFAADQRRLSPKEWWVKNGWASTFSEEAVEQAVSKLRKAVNNGDLIHPDLLNLGERLRQLARAV